MEYASGLFLFMTSELVYQFILYYSLIFFLSYYSANIYNKINKRSELLSHIFGGMIIAGILAVTTAVADNLSISRVPSSGFLLVGYATLSFGPVSGIIAAVLSSVIILNLEHRNIFMLLLIQTMNLGLFYLLQIIMKRLKRNLREYEMVASVLIIDIIITAASYLLVPDKTAYLSVVRNAYLSVPLEAILFTTLLYKDYREKEQNELLHNYDTKCIELVNKNSEIETLYKEVTANEEKLRHNYEELSIYEERLEYLAFHENQTGFFNGEKLLEQLRKKKRDVNHSCGSMLIIGIEEVEKLEKTIGIILMDTLHYLVGIEVMAIFEEVTNGQVYSIAKGKYAILVDCNINEERIQELSLSLRKRFTELFVINTVELKVHIAIGGIHFTEVVDKPEQWMEQCEFALNNATFDDLGRTDIVWFGQELMKEHVRKLKIEQELYKAIENNELYLVYQPQYDNSRKLIGAEALLRWKHSELGEIPPGVFIPIAEKNGLIDSIGKIVIQNACSFINQNRTILIDTDNKIPLSVNASFLELINPYFAERFLLLVKDHNISYELIRVEITESEIAMHYHEVSENLRQLHEAGIGVELDDFGTGYSSLSHLGSMPVHSIKIDKVFIDKVLIDNRIGDLVEMIIDFAHRFKMRVIAEGVETEEQFLWLKGRGCDAYQGFYFAKPLTEELFLSKLQNN